ncbi:HNH endonuclease signature motif containing protein [Ferrimonas gelatinilytica]|uniref:HNH nuclease domain-containing protein n=1 Tax=Ferrimonas gelatinilytica TaxID=1255257 RepID=A0ABP9SAF2_9GAMM
MEKKLARICWNTFDWQRPSGPKGKSLDRNCFEYQRGYGHEEWLKDTSKLIDGYKYSFLQPVNTSKKRHAGQSYAVWLYTMEGKQKSLVGCIKKVDCLTAEEAQRGAEQHQQNGWFEEMREQLTEQDIDTRYLIEDEPLHNFNIKFKPQDLEWFDEPINITMQYGNNRYVLLNVSDAEFKQTLLLEDDLAFDLNELIEDSDLSASERESQVMARIGQGKFRKDVINLWGGEKCAVTLVNVKEMLIASHIKAWKNCETKEERLDGANGILLCAHLDKLFDYHLITFLPEKSHYALTASEALDIKQLKGMGVEEGTELSTTHLDRGALKRFEGYMAHHNAEFERKQNEYRNSL